MLGEKVTQQLCNQILKRCTGDEAEVLLTANNDALTRLANNSIHQNVAEHNASITLRTFIGSRAGTATTNQFAEAALDELVAHAHLNAQTSPADPNYPGLPDPAAYQSAAAFDEATAACAPERRARAVGAVCQAAASQQLNASGAFSTGYDEIAVANSKGLFAYHTATHADFQTVVMSPDSSGRAHASAWQAAAIPVEALGAEAIQKAESGRHPQKIEAGEYPVVFDPYVTEDLLSMLNFHGMGAQAVLEGRSWLNDRMGQKVMSDQVDIWDDGLDPQGMPMPFDYEGVPKQRVDIVKAGVVQGPVYDRYTAHKAGAASTGHALPPTLRGFGPIATNLFMAPGIASVDEMIRSTEKGLYITRFWYTRLVHPRDCVITGMTRDGVWMIENGKLAFPVKNLRFTQSYVEALANVEAVSHDRRLIRGKISVVLPRVFPP